MWMIITYELLAEKAISKGLATFAIIYDLLFKENGSDKTTKENIKIKKSKFMNIYLSGHHLTFILVLGSLKFNKKFLKGIIIINFFNKFSMHIWS